MRRETDHRPDNKLDCIARVYAVVAIRGTMRFATKIENRINPIDVITYSVDRRRRRRRVIALSSLKK